MESTIVFLNELLDGQSRKIEKQCVECGSTKNIQVHHFIYRKGHHLWEYNVNELIPLCKKCHQKIHDDKTHRFHEKYSL